MAKCGVKRGFLMLRDCGTRTNSHCSTCKRPVCGEHLHASSGSGYCVECVARQRSADHKDSDEGYAFAFRHSYYNTSAYRPIYLSSQRDLYYDEYDARGFDRDDLKEMDYGDADDVDDVDLEDS